MRKFLVISLAVGLAIIAAMSFAGAATSSTSLASGNSLSVTCAGSQMTISPSSATAVSLSCTGAAPTNMAPPSGYTSSELTFDDQFSGTSLNSSAWKTYIEDANSQGNPWNSNGAGDSGINSGSYDAEYFQPSAVTVNNGVSISATRGSTQSGYTWTSGVLSTYGDETITNGYVQVRAWMPDTTTGMWPGIWFLGQSSELPEIDLQEGGYNYPCTNVNGCFAANYHNGSATQTIAQTSTNMASGWHVYGLQLTSSTITMYLDGVQMASYPRTSQGAYFLLIDLQVAQNTSGWHTVVSSSTPSPSVMKVSEVQFYS